MSTIKSESKRPKIYKQDDVSSISVKDLGIMFPLVANGNHEDEDITFYVRNIQISLPGEIVEPKHDGVYFLQNEKFVKAEQWFLDSYSEEIMKYICDLDKYNPEF